MYKKACDLKDAQACAKVGDSARACDLGDGDECTKGCLRGREASCSAAISAADPTAFDQLCTKGKTQACDMKQCVSGDGAKCDALCKLEVMGACEKGSEEIRSRVEQRIEKRRAEDRLPVLMAACERNRARWMQANVAASQAHTPAAQSAAEDAQQESKDALIETRHELQEVVIKLTSGTRCPPESRSGSRSPPG